jgi:hypothetical protein
VEESKYGDDSTIELAFFRFYPELKNYIKKVKEGKNQFYVTDFDFVKEFINSEYEKNDFLIKTNMAEREIFWRKKENIYFELVDELFEEKYWGVDEYIAYATIWGVYPKFIEEKSFQIPVIRMNEDFTANVIAHEMLHFIFYNYFLKNYSQYNMNDNSFFVWNVSEAFNEVVQGHPKWIEAFKMGVDVYGGREDIVKRLQEKYYKSDKINVKELIGDIIKEIDNSNSLILKD